MNASDQRNAESIKAIAVRGALGETFTENGDYLSVKQGNRKLIILDEADNISGQEDKGGNNGHLRARQRDEATDHSHRQRLLRPDEEERRSKEPDRTGEVLEDQDGDRQRCA